MAGADIRHSVEIDFLDAVNGTSRSVTMADGKHLRVTIPTGSEDGDVLRLKGQGLPGLGGGSAGDLLIELRIKPHPVFTRKGRDIYAELPITLSEAVLGGKVEVPTVDGSVSLTIPKGSNTGSRLRVRGKGVPAASGGARGDHYVDLKVVLPTQPDPELVRLIEEWAAKHPYQVRSGT
jgi:DnaJ-class molecular chaperone